MPPAPTPHPPTATGQLDLIGWVLTLRSGALAIGPHLRQEFRGLSSVYTENMTGYQSAPVMSSESYFL